MKRVTVSIKLHYANTDEGRDAEVETNNVPITMVLESLNNIVKGLARQIVEDAAEVIPGPDQEKYFDSRLELDRKLLEDLIAKAPEINNNEVPRYSFEHMIGFAKWYAEYLDRLYPRHVGQLVLNDSQVIGAYTRYLKEKKP
jgi:hypothetical protein